MTRELENALENIVRIGTVTWVDPNKRIARVKYQDMDNQSGELYVLANRPYIPDYGDAQRTEFESGGGGDAAFENHKHDVIIKPWMPKVNATVLCLYLPVWNGDGFILGEIGGLGEIKQ